MVINSVPCDLIFKIILKAQSVLSVPLISHWSNTDGKIASLPYSKVETFTTKATVLGGDLFVRVKPHKWAPAPIRVSRGIQISLDLPM